MFYGKTSRQILQEGINEAGGMSSWIAAATSSQQHNVRIMVPFYVYYSMFGFQRIRRPGLGGERHAGGRASCSAAPPGAPRSTVKACQMRTGQPHPGRHHPQLRRRLTTRPSRTRPA